MRTRIQTHARQRLAFTAQVPLARRLDACKRFLRLEDQMIRMRHRGGESGQTIVRSRAALIDTLLQRLLPPALEPFEQRKDTPPIALAALGGYGRAELSPLSDIDIMFVHPTKSKGDVVKAMQEKINGEVVLLLWDLGLKVGPSFRSIDEALAEARRDMHSKTSMLEARFVAGAPTTFRTFEQAYRNFYRKDNPAGYIAARLQDQRERRAKYGHTVFLQEPEIKNGVGGLRDYQNVLWMAQVKLETRTMDELCEARYLRPNELREMNRAYNFLLRVRNQLHFESRKPTDILHLEKQPHIARQLGYDERDALRRVEAFMRDYYRCAQTIFRTSRVLEHRLALTPEDKASEKISFREVLRSRRHTPTKRIDGFVLRGRELTAENDEVFTDDPARLVRVFRHCQQLNAHLEFELSTQIAEQLPLLTRQAIATPEINRSFRAILGDIGKVYPTLSQMHELGVLGRFIPEWDRLTCLVQHELYHRYTADVHTLNTIRELDEVFTNPEPPYLGYREALREASLPEILYPTLLLHDIGKGKSIKNHSEEGVVISVPLLQRLGYEKLQREVILFLIKNHLTMARFWQRLDLDDPQTTQAFVDVVEDEEHLRLLYALTFCDARATSTDLWNSYKDTLHSTLFRNTVEYFAHGPAVAQQAAKRFEMTKADLQTRQIPGVSPEEVAAHFSLLPERYFVHTDNDEIALHLEMVNRLLKTIISTDTVGSLQPIIDWRDDLNRSLTVVNVVTWDRAGLFYKLAGAFALAGLNILTAKIISRADHIAIDTFYVVEPGRGVIQNEKSLEQFQKNVHSALISNKDLYPEIQVQARKLQNRLLGQDPNPLLASFTPRIEIYHELSLQRTIVEVQAPDQVGLLYRLSKAIYDHGFDITFARINTERGLAIDTFYIESANKAETTESPRLMELRENLGRIVSPQEREAVDY